MELHLLDSVFISGNNTFYSRYFGIKNLAVHCKQMRDALNWRNTGPKSIGRELLIRVIVLEDITYSSDSRNILVSCFVEVVKTSSI